MPGLGRDWSSLVLGNSTPPDVLKVPLCGQQTKVGRLTLPRFLTSSLLDYGAPVICGTRWRSGDGANQLSHILKSNMNPPSPVAHLQLSSRTPT
ncbi:hypothetical protein GmHk_14G041011 [Glycine max]|nr:hypothetical protein GmHk_14G041011 [Glycine max]